MNSKSDSLNLVPNVEATEHPLVLQKLAYESAASIECDWLKKVFPSKSDADLRKLNQIFMAIYANHRASSDLMKTRIMSLLKANHISTSNHYINLGFECGYLRAEPNPADGRSELLKPTDALIRDIEKELARRAAEIVGQARIIQSHRDSSSASQE